MGTHILILVDDDPLHAAPLSSLLADAGYETSVLTDKSRIIPFLHEHAVSLVLVNAAQPSVNSHRDPPITVSSVYDTAGGPVRGGRHGSENCVAESNEAAEMLARVQGMLRRAESGRGDARATVGNITLPLNWFSCIASSDGTAPATPTEMQLLEWMMAA